MEVALDGRTRAWGHNDWSSLYGEPDSKESKREFEASKKERAGVFAVSQKASVNRRLKGIGTNLWQAAAGGGGAWVLAGETSGPVGASIGIGIAFAVGDMDTATINVSIAFSCAKEGDAWKLTEIETKTTDNTEKVIWK